MPRRAAKRRSEHREAGEAPNRGPQPALDRPADATLDILADQPSAVAVMSLFDYLPETYLYAKDRQSRFIKVNRGMLALYGKQREADVLGDTDYDHHPPVLAEAYRAEDRRVMEAGKPAPNQVWLVPHYRGTPRWYVSSKTPLHGPTGEIIGIVGVMYPIATPEEQGAYFQELAPIVAHIESHFREVVSMEDMAERIGLSSTHFNRRFRQLLRISPTEYLLSLRVQEAQRLLTTTSQSIAEIALEVGFYDQSHFAKRFRRVTGLSPRQYRSQFR